MCGLCSSAFAVISARAVIDVFRRYYRNRDLDIDISAIGLYAYGFGHAPLGWGPHRTPFNPEFEWSFATLPGISRVIQKWAGAVDFLQVNVGIWGQPLHAADSYQTVAHFNTGDAEAAKEELREMRKAVKEVRSMFRDQT